MKITPRHASAILGTISCTVATYLSTSHKPVTMGDIRDALESQPKETKPRFNNITPGVLGQKVEAFRPEDLVTEPRPARSPVAPAASEPEVKVNVVADSTELRRIVQGVQDSLAGLLKRAAPPEPSVTPEPVKLTEEEALKLGKVIVVCYDDPPAVALVSSRIGGYGFWETIAMEHGNVHRFGRPNEGGWFRLEDYPALAARYVEAEAKRRGR